MKKLALLLVLFGPIGLRAQQTATSQISGVVTDPSGSAVPNAEIKVTQTETDFTRTLISGPDGAYTIPNLPVGPYRLQVTASGFSVYVQSGIILQVNSNPVINPALRVGAVSEQVQVSAEVAMTETHENSISQVIDQRRIEDLPLNGRNPTQLVLLSGGAANGSFTGSSLNGSKNYSTQSVTFSVAGGQLDAVNYVMDGGDNNDAFSNVNLPFPFPDALQEFSVQTNALPARYGLHSGAVVNLVTKSGSNAIHGDLFEFLRNGDLNARNFFAPVHDALKRNQFGGTAGGPILRDRLFFFGGYQGTRTRTDPPTTQGIVPNLAMLSGDFTTALSTTCRSAPLTLTGFANDHIPVSQFNQQALNLLTYIPLSNDPCGRITYGIPNNSAEDQYIGRIDFNQSERHSIFSRYFISDYRNPAVFDGKNALTTTKPGVAPRSQSFTVGDTYSLTPTTISAFHATFNRLRIFRGPADNLISPNTVGINISQYVPNFIYLQVNNFFTLGCGTCSPGFFNTNTLPQIAEDVDLIRGAHQISFGVNYIHVQLNSLSNNIANGQYTFNSSITGYGLADFLLGQPSAFTQSNPQRQNNRYNYLGLYVQDAWRVSRRLSINAGLRWEPYFPAYDRYGRGSHFELSDFLAGKRSSVFVNGPAGESFYGDPSFPRGDANSHWPNFGPRLGVVIDPAGDGRQTIRASYGILYNTPETYYNIRFVSAPPYGNQINIPNPAGGLTNPYQGFQGGNPFPQVFPPPKDVAFPPFGVYVNIPLNVKPTYVQLWNVSYQRQLTGNWLVSANYLGSKTTHLWLATEANPAAYLGPSSTTGNTNQRRVLYLIDPAKGGLYGTMGQTDDGANSHYNGLLVSLQHRFSHNFTSLTNYTYSHCIGDGDFTGELTGPLYQNPNNRAGDRGNCGFDRRQIFNHSLVVSSPRFPNKLAQRLAGNWQLSGILSVSTGEFFNVLTGTDRSLTGVNLDRPNVVGNYQLSNASFNHWFNPGAFQANALGSFGNAGHNIMLGPKTVNFDMGLVREFGVREAMRLEFRGEAFNVINHANMDMTIPSSGTNLHNQVSDPLFGSITGAADPRILQLALKLKF
jgi:hypothetical protein